MPAPTARELFDLTGQTFLVVGGARTLGFDMALALAEAGANGAVTSRNPEAAVTAATAIHAATGRTMHGFGLDAGDEASVQAGVTAAHAALGRIDVLINSVGGGGGGSGTSSGRIEERMLQQWELIQRTNSTALFLICKHVVPHMRAQKAGSIINVASIAGLVGRDRRIYPPEMTPQSVDYATAKAAVIGFTTDLAGALGGDGIRVNVISPGGFERGQPPVFVQAYGDRCMLGRMGRDGIDLKGAAVFLASNASAYVTGHNLIVDGGFSRWR